VRVSGRVVNTVGVPVSLIALTPRNGGMGPLVNRANPLDATGRFEIEGVAPGSYSLLAVANRGGKSYSASQPLEIGNQNIENVSLTIGPGLEIDGRVRVEGNSQSSLTRVRAALQSRESSGVIFGSIPNSDVNEDGTFQLEQVNPGRYTVVFTGLPEGYYVKSIRWGDADVLGSGLDVTSGAPGVLGVVLSPNAGQIAGVVRNPQTGQPAPGASVALIPQEQERRGQPSYYKTATADQSGCFTLKNLAPGQYKAYAWEDLEAGAQMDPDFLKPFESKGQSVAVAESSQAAVQLALIRH
jgi:uncharacterized surface anchored protein